MERRHAQMLDGAAEEEARGDLHDRLATGMDDEAVGARDALAVEVGVDGGGLLAGLGDARRRSWRSAGTPRAAPWRCRSRGRARSGRRRCRVPAHGSSSPPGTRSPRPRRRGRLSGVWSRKPETPGRASGSTLEVAVVEVLGGEGHRAGLAVRHLEDRHGHVEEPSHVERHEVEAGLRVGPSRARGLESDGAVLVVAEVADEAARGLGRDVGLRRPRPRGLGQRLEGEGARALVQRDVRPGRRAPSESGTGRPGRPSSRKARRGAAGRAHATRFDCSCAPLKAHSALSSLWPSIWPTQKPVIVRRSSHEGGIGITPPDPRRPPLFRAPLARAPEAAPRAPPRLGESAGASAPRRRTGGARAAPRPSAPRQCG